MRHLPEPFFLTKIGLANHSVWATFLMILALINFSTSALVRFALSVYSLQSPWRIGYSLPSLTMICMTTSPSGLGLWEGFFEWSRDPEAFSKCSCTLFTYEDREVGHGHILLSGLQLDLLGS
ncbi:hypothetical protein GUJ93_ZPchr0001g32239 [Zizania palustris]|uniref:Uncharacterized protein n=1 Tax=Zizania palustris TaxID=103762 RepID=A0A8J5VAD0_ZIZPA|nr:hypothetical protein GUJ93_ZPchr0001g32239 [Zizania palustris]